MTHIETLRTILVRAKETGATDLHLTAAAKPMVRFAGAILPLHEFAPMQPDDIKDMLFALLSEGQKEELSKHGDLDTAFGIRGIGRFRINIYRQRGSMAAAIRLMYPSIPTIETACIPDAIKHIAKEKSGLVLAAGPKGCGKSTTITALLHEINTTRNCHVLTIEDPIEYLFRHDRSIVEQREVGLDCKSYAAGIRAAVREDPDVIFVGEMREKETIEATLSAAETGHLVFSTIHVNSPDDVAKRILHAFGDSDKERVQDQMSSVLKYVIAPNLIHDETGKIKAEFRLLNKGEIIV